MEHVWSVLCNSSSVDMNSKLLSLFEVTEGINFAIQEAQAIEEGDVIPISLTLVSMLWRTDLEIEEEGLLRVNIKSPVGEMLEKPSATTEVKLMGDTKRFRVRSTFRGIPYYGNGVYRFIVQLTRTSDDQWDQVADVPLEINRTDTPSE